MAVHAHEVQVGDIIPRPTQCGYVCQQVTRIVTNPHFGWIGFMFNKAGEPDDFAFAGWYLPDQEVA